MLAEAMGIIYGVREEREIKEKRDKGRDTGREGAAESGLPPLAPNLVTDEGGQKPERYTLH